MSWSAVYEFLESRLGTTLLALLLTWLLGSWISAYWTSRQKRKEAEITAAQELYDLYGEFLAIWKLWNGIDHVGDSAEREKRRAGLLERATLMEGRFESLLLRLTSQLWWSHEALTDLGLLRQIFQFPRSQMTRHEPIPWNYSEHPQYLAFKRTCSRIGAKLAKRSARQRTVVERSQRAFIYTTANTPHEANFAGLADDSQM